MSRAWKPAVLIAIAMAAVACAAPEPEEPEEPEAAPEPAAVAEVPDATVVDPEHYKVEFENDRVRVVRITYGPGEESVMHHHPDHVAVMLTGLQGEFRMPDGTTQEVNVEAGDHIFVPAGQHHPRNTGEEPFEAVAIELKSAGSGATPTAEEAALDATVVDPDRYQVEFENEQVSVVRITYGPGEESVMHHHPDHVAVMLTGLEGEFRLPDGTTQEVNVEAGDHIFVPAGQHHPRNNGEEPFEAVMVALK